jgi:oxygen-independent coproporphyrinogen-3 oxidase
MPYCDFNSHEARGECPKSATSSARHDLELALPSIWGARVVSVFIGGGTPSLFSAAAIDHAARGDTRARSAVPDAEVTLEANPGTSSARNSQAFSPPA